MMLKRKAPIKTLFTAADPWQSPEGGRWYELVRRELFEMTPPGGQYGPAGSPRG